MAGVEASELRILAVTGAVIALGAAACWRWRRLRAGLQRAPTSLPPREYVLLISGTMNPPHVGHVRLGLAAAEKLRATGHRVGAICYLPVHDNYICNKVLQRDGNAQPSDLGGSAPHHVHHLR